MKNDRFRQPVKPNYTNALGHAAYCFAVCEWQVVWCCEKIRPGSLSKVIDEELTAGKIAKRFIDLARNMPSSANRERLKKSAEKFMTLVESRNQIFHGKPCTGPNGEARISGMQVLEIADLEDAADAFSECAIELNDVFFGFMST